MTAGGLLGRLTVVEVRRLFARRLAKVGLLLGLVIVGISLYGTYSVTRPPSAPERAESQAQFEQAQREFSANGEQMVADCLAQQAKQRQTQPDADFGCDQMQPRLENFGRPVARFEGEWRPALQGTSYVAMFLAFLIGAGFVAAEISTGSLATWLTFQPRRGAVLAAKFLAVALGALLMGALLLGLSLGGVRLVLGAVGTTALPAGDAAQLWATLGRGVLLSGVAALSGAALGALLRHTAAALGLVVGYLIVVEGMFAGLVQSLRPWLLALNVTAWLEHGATYSVQRCANSATGEYSCQSVDQVLGFGRASVYLGVLLVLLLAVTFWLFRRRDVT
ncbi:MAG TPA: ABC transporter permease subunit [Dermatophilaceae bacterium]|nr:ABC transporter permease subunit [Dermatophilaceae bacterium]